MTDAADPPVVVEEPEEVSPASPPVASGQRAARGRFAPGHGGVPGCGRKPRVPQRNRTMTVERINASADPIGRLCRIAAGKRFRAAPAPGAPAVWMEPTPADVMSALRILAGKVLPDLRAIDMKSESDTPPLILNFVQATKVGGDK